MVEVKIPFLQRFKDPMRNGTKTMTSRTRKYGVEGDTFKAFGETFVLTRVYKQMFWQIADRWKEEGCRSKLDFLNVWKAIHPRKEVLGHDLFWVHEFKKQIGYGNERRLEMPILA